MKRLARVFTSAVLVGTMVMTMGGMTAFATNLPDPDPTPDTPPTSASPAENVAEITKIINKRANVYAPNATFKFIASEGSEISGANLDANAVIPGIVISNNGELTSSPTEETLGSTSYEVGKLTITAEGSYPAPGKYRYEIQEEGAQQGNAEGITYDTEKRYFDVIVSYQNGANVVTAATMVTENGLSKDWGKIWNGYGFEPGSENPEPNDEVNDLTITKVVAGNQGNRSEEFTFDITVTDEDNNSELYYVMYADTNGTTRQNLTLESGKSEQIKLKHGESVTITGLSKSDKYTVTEVLDVSEGYTTTVKVGSADAIEGLTTNEQTMGSANTTITVFSVTIPRLASSWLSMPPL